MKGVVFGAGYMGKRIADHLGYILIGKDLINCLNLKKIDELVEKIKPDIVINAVGKTGRPNIDWCETNQEETIAANVMVPANLSTVCKTKGMYFIHLSSGCIYNGYNSGKGFSELDEPNFRDEQFYAKTKILAESIVSKNPALQLRIRMPIDDRSHDRNLIDKLLKYDRLIDLPNSMTTVPHFLGTLEGLISQQKLGIYNVTNPGLISAKDVMNLYQEIIDPNHSFELMTHAELDLETLGKRSNCKLDTTKLELEGFGLPKIHDATRECLLRYRENLL